MKILFRSLPLAVFFLSPPSYPQQEITAQDARIILFRASPLGIEPDTCRGGDNPAAEIECLIRLRYREDRRAEALAVNFYRRLGCVAGLLPEENFDGAYRGIIHLVPQLPVGKERKHLEFVTEALYSYQELFQEIQKRSPKPLGYRARDLSFFFFRSQRKRTPAAFAWGWSVAYNTNGTLNYGREVVRELLFHEIFHLNDRAHGDWSSTALKDIYASIRKKCGTDLKCLAPYARGFVKVRGGTYYAFTPGNDVEEYAAEMAIQYLREQRAALAGRPVKKPFKCGPEENARAWRLLIDEFFGSVDLVPNCPTGPK